MMALSRIATKVVCAELSSLTGSYDQCSIPRNNLCENTPPKAKSDILMRGALSNRPRIGQREETKL